MPSNIAAAYLHADNYASGVCTRCFQIIQAAPVHRRNCLPANSAYRNDIIVRSVESSSTSINYSTMVQSYSKFYAAIAVQPISFFYLLIRRLPEVSECDGSYEQA